MPLTTKMRPFSRRFNGAGDVASPDCGYRSRGEHLVVDSPDLKHWGIMKLCSKRDARVVDANKSGCHRHRNAEGWL